MMIEFKIDAFSICESVLYLGWDYPRYDVFMQTPILPLANLQIPSILYQGPPPDSFLFNEKRWSQTRTEFTPT